MIPRKRLDIGWGDLFAGMRYCICPVRRETVEVGLWDAWGDEKGAVCLSVRSGFDALLTALEFAPGSDILVSALTITDMTRVIEAHGLVPVPVDVDAGSLSVCGTSMRRAVSSEAKMILVAHLFGSRMPMAPVIAFAKEHGLVVVEDCAQAFTGDGYRGHPESDVCLFSFGPIKTATALGGGIVVFRDVSLRNEVAACQAAWPSQRRTEYLARVCKYSMLVLLSYRIIYSAFVRLCNTLGLCHDSVIGKITRGFSGRALLEQLRRQPCVPLLRLMARRLRGFDPARVGARTRIVNRAICAMPDVHRPGNEAEVHTHWVFPMLVADPVGLRDALWRNGFDATIGASSMGVVEAPMGRSELVPGTAAELFARLLYLPVYEGVSVGEVERMAGVLKEYAEGREFGHDLKD